MCKLDPLTGGMMKPPTGLAGHTGSVEECKGGWVAEGTKRGQRLCASYLQGSGTSALYAGLCTPVPSVHPHLPTPPLASSTPMNLFSTLFHPTLPACTLVQLVSSYIGMHLLSSYTLVHLLSSPATRCRQDSAACKSPRLGTQVRVRVHSPEGHHPGGSRRHSGIGGGQL